MKKLVILLMSLGTFGTSISAPPAVCAANSEAAPALYQQLTKPGEKVLLRGGCYFTYGFEKQPKLGTCIMRVEVFGRDGKRDTSFAVKGDADMPSMKGAHSSGNRDFALSAKGVYLLPVRLVMPGDWEIKLTLLDKEKSVFHGAYRFDL